MIHILIDPFVAARCFELAECASIDAASFNSCCCARRNGRFKCGYEVSGNRILQNLPEMRLLLSVSSCICHFIEALSVCIVLLVSAPFQITCAIILFVLVNMVYARKIIWIWDKSFCNKPMYWYVSAGATSMYGKIPATELWFKYSWYSSMSVTYTNYISKIAYFINTLKPGRISPDFFHNSLIYNKLKIQN